MSGLHPAAPQEPGARGENRLGAETSPYLRQHRHDPVDWYPWGPEAFARAKELDRPLFLSIGYSACHWCHVMAHESFADEATAEEMNQAVVAIKVDREERPDVDAVYMEAVQAATGHGGWPMSVFATPDGRPFYTGTYFPNRPGGGVPTFRRVLAAVTDAWDNQREAVVDQAEALSEAVARRLAPPAPPSRESLDGSGGAALEASPLDGAAVRSAIEAACRRLGEMADRAHGGFGRAPKFPQPLFLDLLLRAHVEG
ncbi:MAG TPA: thioredoxin domain-containing protein, partial [Acidimicrobiales bacterium]|nr:thioredoxin domain-containing protein [Acidimicrobiales bacterium]